VNETEADQVTHAILKLFRDPVQREQMGVAGRAAIAARFTWEHAAEQYLALLATE
jgi:glycosyltransferase involved in cell wall biosynthesis